MMQIEECLKKIGDDIWFTEVDRNNLKIDYRIKEIIYQGNSPIQQIMILDSYDFGPMLVLDDAIQTTSNDGYIYNEMIAHVPLNIHPNPKNVLIIGGGDCGAAREVTKYPNVERIDMVEIDEMVVQTCRKYLPKVSGKLSDPRVNFIFEDGTAFVKEQRDYLYDVVIIDSSDPVGPAVKLFELEFYKDIYSNLREDGLMVCQSESPIFYSEMMVKIHKNLNSLFPIVKTYMATVPTYPGGFWTFTMGSKKYWKPNPEKFDKDTKYINKEILESCFILPKFIEKLLDDN
ncbi:Spermidine synthase [Tepidanaerobacter acetatoxydans Re1]|uniref:Polyamine aminopropyltransferase n=1 Tax=Tepidanaerobacter acetatoxydans (strain DSM 21804 / JCM 16047 / Re1) TaxID=1209989 RepID=F4LUK9_TEPAE|nr:polyamine aminopropyltransferase [Tepidanaerobacter acetatoxydans]AEE92654.1 Spermidine synthase [Tepidanaerobacter acetatoxydans Re1]CCP27628.1 Spermidine synthase [Tepidanaerobacter acetatoxydans Re1]